MSHFRVRCLQPISHLSVRLFGNLDFTYARHYSQSNVMWHQVAPALARRFTLVIPDLPGYGWSAAPRAGADHSPYTKRAMAAVMIEVMEKLGFVRFHLAGHDRGGRVAYRLALDHPGRLE